MGLHGNGYFFKKDNHAGSTKRTYRCDECGEEGPNRGKKRIRKFTTRDPDGAIVIKRLCPTHWHIGEEEERKFYVEFL